MCTHLFRREGGTYYFRRAIPTGKRSQFGGRREWIVSLRTKDRAEAKRLIPGYVQAFDRAMLGDVTGDDAEKPLRGLAAPFPVNTTVSATAASSSPVRTSVPLLDTFEAYVREQGIKAVTANEWRGNLRALVRYVGHDDAARFTVENIDAWRDFLLTEKTKRGGLRSP